MVFVAAKPNPKENRFRSVGATIRRPFFHAKRQQTKKQESFGGTRATDGRAFEAVPINPRRLFTKGQK